MYKIRLMGAISLDWDEKYIIINSETKKEQLNTLKDILVAISEEKKNKFWTYFDSDFSPKRGTIIIINGMDFNVLDGLETQISSEDDITFVPTISGG